MVRPPACKPLSVAVNTPELVLAAGDAAVMLATVPAETRDWVKVTGVIVPDGFRFSNWSLAVRVAVTVEAPDTSVLLERVTKLLEVL